jgi:UDP-glucose 4-epimerase
MRPLAVVTGGAGFIGSELVAQLVREGYRVRILDNLATGSVDNVQAILGSDCELLELDIRDSRGVEPAIKGADVLFHLACLGVRHSIHSPFENHAVNADATLRLLLSARDRDVRRFVQVSSSEVYGTARSVPMREDHPTRPATVYGASKLAGESYARAFWSTYRYPTVVVRPFNAFGPRCHHEGDSGEVIPKFLLRSLAGLPLIVFGDGSQTRDFSYVSDTARGILLAGRADAAVGLTLNLGSGREVSILDLAQLVAQAAGRSPAEVRHDPERPGDVRRLLADSTSARETLGYQGQVSLAEGLARLRAWYDERGRTPAELLEQERVRNWEPR